MTDEEGSGLFLGQALTNRRPGSIFALDAEPTYSVRYQFVCAANGPFASLAGDSATSTELVGGMVFISPRSRIFSLQGPVQLGRAKDVQYMDASGKPHALKASVINLWNARAHDTVDLYFGLDALRGHRRQPLFTLGPISCESVVTIFEKPGPLGNDTSLTLTHVDAFGVAWYSAVLSGDTWKACTPPFSVTEAKAILATAKVRHPTIDTAIEGIYGGGIVPHAKSGTYRLELDVPAAAADGSPTKLALVWGQTGCGPKSNPALNTTAMDPTVDVQVRVHPHAYIAVLAAALKCGVQAVEFNSSWRPMLGPGCGHRHADCLDLGSITDSDGAVQAFVWRSITSDEQQTLDELNAAEQEDARCQSNKAKMDASLKKLSQQRDQKQAEVENLDHQIARAQIELDAAQSAQDALGPAPDAGDKGYKAAKLKWNIAKQTMQRKVDLAAKKLSRATDARDRASSKLETLQAQVKQAEQERPGVDEAASASTTRRTEANKSWQSVVDANQSESLSEFRQALSANVLVRQLIDPWYIDYVTPKASHFNHRRDSTERAHLNHLHLTCVYPEVIDFMRHSMAGY